MRLLLAKDWKGSLAHSEEVKAHKQQKLDRNKALPVGDMRSWYMRSNEMWGAIRGAHNKRNNSVQAHTRTYAQVEAEWLYQSELSNE